jgi:hypothetical protein
MEVAFQVPKVARHRFIERVLRRLWLCATQGASKGVLLRYLERITRLSCQQVTRLVRQYRQDEMLSHRPCPPRYVFLRRFTTTDVAAPADMDALHGTYHIWPGTKKLMERAFLVFTDARFERLAEISGSRLSNLRGGTPYQRTR